MSGTATVGSEKAFARGDHVHPSDTAKADKATTLAGYGITDAYTKSQVDGLVTGALHCYAYNLLDNSDFTNPVNQRGQTNYTDWYTIDRWRIWSGSTVTVNANSVTVNGTMLQYLCGLPEGKSLTFAYGNETETHIGFAGYDTNLGYYYVNVPTGEWTWAALYEGEYTAETLPKYMSKGYGVELAECQRYYYRIPAWAPLGYGVVNWTGTDTEISVPVGTEMRVIPSVLENVTVYLRMHGYAGGIVVSNKTPTVGDGGRSLTLTYAGVIGDTTYAYNPIVAYVAETPFEFSADL